MPLLSESAASSSEPASSTSLPQHFSPLPPASLIPPLVSLELRVRWLEALVSGLDTRKNARPQEEVNRKGAKGLVRMTQDVQRELDEILEANDALRRFTNTCVCHTIP